MHVSVTTAGGTSVASPGSTFSFSQQQPGISSLSPTSGPAAGGTFVTIRGTAFTGATRVRFGAVDAPAFSVIDATTIVALSPPGAGQVFGLSTQDNVYQTEMASRLHLPFPVLSDDKLALSRALRLPTMDVAGLTLIKRLALVVDDGVITHVFYPVFPPDRNAGDVLAWLKDNPV